MIKKLLLSVVLILFLTVSASAGNPIIKIGLKYAGTAQTQYIIKSTSGFYMKVNEENVLWVDDNELIISLSSSGGIDVLRSGASIYTYTAQATPLEVLSNDGTPLTFIDKQYRGSLVFFVSDGKITAVNQLPMDAYLKGVISCEMISSWHIEALKAQSVAARGFAMTNMNKFAKYGFNLDDTTTSQVYRGVSAETESCTRAVEETAGIMPMYNEKVAQTIFFDSSGGKTENAKDVWGSEIPYLVVVDDIYEEVKEWQTSFTPEDIKTKLSEKGIDIGEVIDLEVVQRSGSERIIDMLIKGTSGEHRLTRQEPRSFFGLKSNLYYINKTTEGGLMPQVLTKDAIIPFTSGIITKDGINNLNFTDFLTKDGIKEVSYGRVTGYEFIGKGYGHAVGMSQWGAKVMAEQGFSYEDIIKFYYPGVYLQK